LLPVSINPRQPAVAFEHDLGVDAGGSKKTAVLQPLLKQFPAQFNSEKISRNREFFPGVRELPAGRGGVGQTQQTAFRPPPRARSAIFIEKGIAHEALERRLDREIVPRLSGGIIDTYLKHRKTTLQFDRSVLGTFPGAELGLQATIDFESETGFGQFDCLAGHSVSVVVGAMVSGLVTASPA
jgi:hypothetical protein